jgi:hypothetical protein
MSLKLPTLSKAFSSQNLSQILCTSHESVSLSFSFHLLNRLNHQKSAIRTVGGRMKNGNTISSEEKRTLILFFLHSFVFLGYFDDEEWRSTAVSLAKETINNQKDG